MLLFKKNQKEIKLLQELISEGKKLLKKNKEDINVPVPNIHSLAGEDPADQCQEFQNAISDIESWEKKCERVFSQIYSGKYLTDIKNHFHAQYSRIDNRWKRLIDSLRRKIDYLKSLIDELEKGYKKSEKESLENKIKSYLLSFVCPHLLLTIWIVLQLNEINIHFSLPQTLSVLSASYFITLSFLEKDEKRRNIISSVASFLPLIIELFLK